MLSYPAAPRQLAQQCLRSRHLCTSQEALLGAGGIARRNSGTSAEHSALKQNCSAEGDLERKGPRAVAITLQAKEDSNVNCGNAHRT